MINRNAMARWIAKEEGKKKEMDIAQIKEVQRLALKYLAFFSDEEVLDLLAKVKKEEGTEI